MSAHTYVFLADTVLAAHAAYVLFVVGGLAMILIGWRCGWGWTRNFWFRLAHLASIGFVVWEAWAGVACPLTVWENQLRLRAGSESYTGSFIAHWLREILFYQAPEWVFIMLYTLFAVVVVVTFVLYPPVRGRRQK